MTSHRTKNQFEGLKTYPVEIGACGTCNYFMVEEVDYPIFVRTDGKEFRIPEGCMPPAMLCIANNGIRSCLRSETCPDYKGEEE